MWKPLPQTCFKNLERKSKRENLERTISASGELRLLQMVLELDTVWCANEDAGSRRVVDCEIPHRWDGRGEQH